MKAIQKTGVYLVMLVFSAIIAGIYGALHDQISYTFSNEYFTQFKFKQFGIPWAYESPRLGAAYVGALATWWMGVIVCSLLGLFGFMFKTPTLMAINLAKSFIVVIAVALITAFIGLFYGYCQINETTIASNMQWVRPEVIDPIQFVRVGYMHNASYLGGITGLVSGIIYLIAVKLRCTKSLNSDTQKAGVGYKGRESG